MGTTSQIALTIHSPPHSLYTCWTYIHVCPIQNIFPTPCLNLRISALMYHTYSKTPSKASWAWPKFLSKSKTKLVYTPKRRGCCFASETSAKRSEATLPRNSETKRARFFTLSELATKKSQASLICYRPPSRQRLSVPGNIVVHTCMKSLM